MGRVEAELVGAVLDGGEGGQPLPFESGLGSGELGFTRAVLREVGQDVEHGFGQAIQFDALAGAAGDDPYRSSPGQPQVIAPDALG